MRERWYCFCSSVPNSMMLGPIQLRFMYWGPRGSRWDSMRSLSCICVQIGASAPPYSLGQAMVSQPRSPSFLQKSLAKSFSSSSLDAKWPRNQGGMFSRQKVSTSSRKSRSFSSQVKSMRCLPGG